ncbi:MAG: serine hydrolase [Deinococcales bacterium]
MTKPITSVAVLMLYEEGHFLLSDPVADYIPAFGICKSLMAWIFLWLDLKSLKSYEYPSL